MWVTPLVTLFERIFVILSRRVILDLEDNVFLKTNLLKQYNPNPLTRFLKNANKQLFLTEKSDYVITSSQN